MRWIPKKEALINEEGKVIGSVDWVEGMWSAIVYDPLSVKSIQVLDRCVDKHSARMLIEDYWEGV